MDEQDGNCFRITLPIGRDAYTEEEIDDDTGDDAAEKIYEGAGEFVPVQPDAAMTDTPSRTRTDHTLLVVDDNEELLLFDLRIVLGDDRIGITEVKLPQLKK